MSAAPGQHFYDALRMMDGECHLVERGTCEGVLQAHHIYPKRILKALSRRLGVREEILIADARNGVLLCKRHHEKVEQGFELFDRGDMPVRLSGFEVQFPLVVSYWPRIYVRRVDHSAGDDGSIDTAGYGSS